MLWRLIISLFLIFIFVAIRTVPVYAGEEAARTLANLSPMAALALCGGMFLPRRLGVGLTFGAFIMSDVLLNLYYQHPLINAYSIILLLAFATLFAVGHFLGNRAGPMAVLGAGVGGTLFFYLLTNTAAYFYDPAYSRGVSGWVQALTTGRPGFPPTWVFGLRSLAGNLVFALAFYMVLRPQVEKTGWCAAPRAA